MSADGTAGAAVHDNREHEPPPSAEAPRGWTWNRPARSWKPKVRGPILWQDSGSTPADDESGTDVQDTGVFTGSTPDPGPSWADDPAPPAEEFVPSASERKDIKALIALGYLPLAETLPALDPYCFGPLQEPKTANGIIDAVADIVADSPKVAKWAVSATGLMPWIKLAHALKPVAMNFVHHHITHSAEVEKDPETGELTVMETDWAQYSAA